MKATLVSLVSIHSLTTWHIEHSIETHASATKWIAWHSLALRHSIIMQAHALDQLKRPLNLALLSCPASFVNALPISITCMIRATNFMAMCTSSSDDHCVIVVLLQADVPKHILVTTSRTRITTTSVSRHIDDIALALIVALSSPSSDHAAKCFLMKLSHLIVVVIIVIHVDVVHVDEITFFLKHTCVHCMLEDTELIVVVIVIIIVVVIIIVIIVVVVVVIIVDIVVLVALNVIFVVFISVWIIRGFILFNIFVRLCLCIYDWSLSDSLDYIILNCSDLVRLCISFLSTIYIWCLISYCIFDSFSLFWLFRHG